MYSFTLTALLVSTLALAGCMTASEPVRFQAGPQQQAVIRDGHGALISKQARSFVSLASVTRRIGKTERPGFAVSIRNTSSRPLDFLVENIQAFQLNSGSDRPLKVYSYEELVAEEQGKQVGRHILGAVVSGLNSAAASRQGIWARIRADENNAALAAQIEAIGEQNLASLESSIVKDNTIFPGEMYSGMLFVDPPSSEGTNEGKAYSIRLTVGSDRHQINVVQGTPTANEQSAASPAPVRAKQATNLVKEWSSYDRPQVAAFAAEPRPNRKRKCPVRSEDVGTIFATLHCNR